MSGVLNKIATGLYSKLSGDATLTALLADNTSIYATLAPKDAEYPFIVFSLQYGGPENITPSDLQDHLYFIRAYAETAKDAGTIHERIAALLHHGDFTVAGYTLVWSALDEEYEDEETTDAGNTVFMRGGSYRFRLDN